MRYNLQEPVKLCRAKHTLLCTPSRHCLAKSTPQLANVFWRDLRPFPPTFFVIKPYYQNQDNRESCWWAAWGRAEWERARRVFFPASRAQLLSALVILSTSTHLWSSCFPYAHTPARLMPEQNVLCAACSDMLTSLKSICRVSIPSGAKSSPSLSSFSRHDPLPLPFSGLPWLLSLRPCLSFTESPQSAFTPILICPTKIPFLFHPPQKKSSFTKHWRSHPAHSSSELSKWWMDTWEWGRETAERMGRGKWENKWWDRVLGINNNYTSWTEPGRR